MSEDRSAVTKARQTIIDDIVCCQREIVEMQEKLATLHVKLAGFDMALHAINRQETVYAGVRGNPV